MSDRPVPLRLADARELIGGGDAAAGALWRLAESGRQLDANLVHLPAGEHVDWHAEPDLDVLLVVLRGVGVMGTDEGEQALTEGVFMWLPHGSRRELRAADDGLYYLTVHRRRPGMRIRSRREVVG